LPGQKTNEFNKELADYAKAATVFKPLSGAMASRFKSAVIVETGPKIIEGLHTPDVSTPDPGPEEVKEEKQDEDPRMAAIRLGMYGPLTREVAPWQPMRLLCKRFGVKDPEVDMGTEESSVPEPFGAPASGGATAESGPAPLPLAITDGSAGDAGTGAVERKGPRNLANVGLGEDEDQGRDTLTYQRPAMDVFKAIFASDDEESDADEEVEAGQSAAIATATTSQESVPPHPNASEPAHPTSAPTPSGSSLQAQPEKVDLASFKPTFVPRADREHRREKEKEKARDKKKKKSATTLVSFDADEDGLQIDVSSAKRKDKDRDGERKKKKRREKKEAAEDDDSMWMEKPAPEGVQNMVLDDVPSAPSPEANPEGVAGPPRGRKRAIDFM
jgi:G patch domain-containing protein 1